MPCHENLFIQLVSKGVGGGRGGGARGIQDSAISRVRVPLKRLLETLMTPSPGLYCTRCPPPPCVSARLSRCSVRAWACQRCVSSAAFIRRQDSKSGGKFRSIVAPIGGITGRSTRTTRRELLESHSSLLSHPSLLRRLESGAARPPLSKSNKQGSVDARGPAGTN